MEINLLQKRLVEWEADTFFGIAKPTFADRRNRFMEEALEAAQACDMPKEDVLELIDYVYSRQAGEIHIELADAMLSLTLLAEKQNRSMEECTLSRLETLETPSKKALIRSKFIRQAENSPLPGGHYDVKEQAPQEREFKIKAISCTDDLVLYDKQMREIKQLLEVDNWSVERVDTTVFGLIFLLTRKK